MYYMFRDTMFHKYCICNCERWQTSHWQVDSESSMIILNAVSSKTMGLGFSVQTRSLGWLGSHIIHVCIFSIKSQLICLENKYWHKETELSISLALRSCIPLFIELYLPTLYKYPCDQEADIFFISSHLPFLLKYTATCFFTVIIHFYFFFLEKACPFTRI